LIGEVELIVCDDSRFPMRREVDVRKERPWESWCREVSNRIFKEKEECRQR
jgi:hypothetical protein